MDKTGDNRYIWFQIGVGTVHWCLFTIIQRIKEWFNQGWNGR